MATRPWGGGGGCTPSQWMFSHSQVRFAIVRVALGQRSSHLPCQQLIALKTASSEFWLSWLALASQASPSKLASWLASYNLGYNYS